MKRKFTLKQLYGYSIMNWKQFMADINELREGRECSFCIDADYDCYCCRIEPYICDLGETESTALYEKIHESAVVYMDKIRDIIEALTTQYNEVEEDGCN